MSIIIADDHPLFRDAMAKKISRHNNTEIIEAGTFSELESALQIHPDPEILILDLRFPGLHTLKQITSLKERLRKTALIIVSMNTDSELVRAVMATGVDGYISKNVPSEQLIRDVSAICNGSIVVNYIPDILPALQVIPAEVSSLTTRQHDVLKLLLEGKSNKEIAQSLGISHFTVRIHVSQVLNTLNASTRAIAIARYSHHF